MLRLHTIVSSIVQALTEHLARKTFNDLSRNSYIFHVSIREDRKYMHETSGIFEFGVISRRIMNQDITTGHETQILDGRMLAINISKPIFKVEFLMNARELGEKETMNHCRENYRNVSDETAEKVVRREWLRLKSSPRAYTALHPEFRVVSQFFQSFFFSFIFISIDQI